MKSSSPFIEPEQLFANLENKEFVIIDCRFDLSDPDWGYADFQSSHIPNAIYADLNKDLSSPITEFTGRHPLPEPVKFIEKCSNWGINENKFVVVYDTTSGSFAARLWWLLRLYGHANVSILNGGFTAWVSAGFPQTNHISHNHPSTFTGKPDHSMTVSSKQMESILTRDNFSIIDARSPERYHGILEPIDAVAGRIPGSINFFHQNNIAPTGKLLSKSELFTAYQSLLENKLTSTKILYCGSGVTSCLNVAVLEYLEIPDVKLYAGSWSEWIRNSNHPIIDDSKPNNI